MAKSLAIPFLIAALLIGGFELAVFYIHKPGFWDRSAWLLHDPYRGEPLDRLVLFEKLSRLEHSAPDIISVGDSSGFFPIQPTLVNRYLKGLRYVNLSTNGNMNFVGYQATADYMLERQPSTRYVVLTMFPVAMPFEPILKQADLAPIVAKNLTGIERYVMPPSAFLSPFVKTWLFERRAFDPKQPLSGHKLYLELRAQAVHTLGWVPEHDVRYKRMDADFSFPKDPEKNAGNFYGLTAKSSIVAHLSTFAELCQRRGVQLFIVFAPMPWTTIRDDGHLYNAEKRLEEFQVLHPEVKILTPLVTPWGPEKFGNFNHVSREYVFESSERMGTLLAAAIADPESVKPFKPSWKSQAFKIPTAIRAQGPATEEQKTAALAFYLYTATADEQYRRYLSARVQTALKQRPSFGWMMDDTRERIAFLAGDGIALGYDPARIKAERVTVHNGDYCGAARGVEWIRLSGAMSFSYRSLDRSTTEPVAWPEASQIVIPIIRENGAYRFDGYCPAAWGAP
jgi:hypothetical protein